MTRENVMAAAKAVRDGLAVANRERQHNDASDVYYAALDALIPLRERLRAALEALPKAERDVFVAMYEVLRCWAYESVGL
jgi:hypothetical protein